MTSSPRKFDLGPDGALCNVSRAVKNADIDDLEVNQVVEVVCKVCDVKDVQAVKKRSGDKKERKKQDVLIRDETKSCSLGFWEQDVNSVEEEESL